MVEEQKATGVILDKASASKRENGAFSPAYESGDDLGQGTGEDGDYEDMGANLLPIATSAQASQQKGS